MNQRILIPLLGLAWLLACGDTSTPAAAPYPTNSTPPNVLLIVADDLGWADLNCYGNPLVQSPNLDDLARKGVQFMQAYAAAPTGPPARYGLQTGRHPARNPQLDLRRSTETLGELAQRTGLRTAHLGRWALGNDHNAPERQGYEHTFAITDRHPDSYYPPFFNDTPPADLAQASKPGDYLPDLLTDHALGLMERWRDSSWLISLNYYTPHYPIEGREDRVIAYRSLIDSTHWRPFPNPRYAAMVDVLDQNVGRLVEKLRLNDQLDHTLIVFTSDNGGLHTVVPGKVGKNTPPTDNGILRGGKGDLYEGGIRVPLILHFPSWATTTYASPQPVTGTDIYPTVGAALGLEDYAAGPDGKNLLPILRGERLAKRTLFWQTPNALAARQGDYKLYLDTTTDSLTYFNIGALPDESLKMAGEPEGFPLRRDLDHWRRVME